MRAPVSGLPAVAAALVLSPALLLEAGCTVGSGAGSAAGPLFFLDCNSDADVGTPAAPTCFDLGPRFFAGEPIEDPAAGVRTNRLIIRLQRTGNRVEITDTVLFDIKSSFEVMRCLRGERHANGTPDWDTRQVVTIKGQCTGVPWCDWSARDGVAESTCVATTAGPPVDQGGSLVPGAPGGAPAPAGCVGQTRVAPGALPLRPLIHFGPEEYVRGSLLPLFTCTDPRLTVAAVGATAIEGWIDFLDFGAATTAVGPSERLTDFKVDFGQRLQASFHIVLQDSHVLEQIKVDGLVPSPRIGGTLDGYFDFDFDRGRAAQPFP